MPSKRVGAPLKTRFSSINWSTLSLRKLFILAVILLAATMVILWMLGSLSKELSMRHASSTEEGNVAYAPPMGYPAMGDRDVSYSYGGTGGSDDPMAPTLSYRNIAPPGYGGGTPAGNDLESFEASDYTATFRKGNIEETCQIIEGLKARTDVVFITAERADESCYYRFKVPKTSSARIMDAVKALNPEEFSVRTETVKGAVTDYTSTLTILATKLAAIEKALTDAEEAYDELTAYATAQNDAETLANVINSKLAMIERLTAERLAVRGEIERINRAKTEEIERIDNVFISVYAFEDPVLDLSSIGDTWHHALRDLIRIINEVLQAVTVGLIAFVFFLIPIAIYGLLILLIAKFGIRIIRKIWKY